MKVKASSRSASASVSAGATTKSPVVRRPRTKKVATEPPVANGVTVVTVDHIAMRAYELFLADGGQHGRDLEHWLMAERELTVGRS